MRVKPNRAAKGASTDAHGDNNLYSRFSVYFDELLAETHPGGALTASERKSYVENAQVPSDGVAGQAGAPGYLADGQLLAQCPTPDDTQCRHVNYSYCSPPLKAAG